MTPPFWQTARQRRAIRTASFRPSLERLGDRIAPAVSASFSLQGGILTVVGDAQDNTIVVGRDAGGNLLVNGGAVAILGGTPTAANTSLIQVLGQNSSPHVVAAVAEIDGVIEVRWME